MKKILKMVFAITLSWFVNFAYAQSPVEYTYPTYSVSLDPKLREPPQVPDFEEKTVHLASEYTKELELRLRKGGGTSAKLYVEQPITKDGTLSMYMSAYKSKGWDEITFGPVYYITPELSVGVGVGTSYYMGISDDKQKHHSTLSAFAYYKGKELEAELLAERYRKDPDAPFYAEGYVQKKVTENLWIGLYGDTDLGWGPRFSFEISDQWSLWCTPFLHRKSETTTICGLKFAF